MKFIVSSGYILKHLSNINKVIATNSLIPILENFLFEIKDGTLTVTGSDLQTSIVAELQIQSKEDGSIAIPAKILIETLKHLPEQPITVTINSETYEVKINSDNGRYKLIGESASDYPKIPRSAEGSLGDFEAIVLNNAIGNTIFAASNDELRPSMMGVSVHLDGEGCTFVATDSHRLVKYTRTDIVSENSHDMLIPKKALTLLNSVLTPETTNVNFQSNASYVFFKFGNVQVISRLIDEKFPEYENVIPVNNENTLEVNRENLLASIRRISIYANKTTHQIALSVKGNELKISAEDHDFSNEASERIDCQHDGENIEIGFNARFLMEILNHLDSEEILIKLNKPSQAGIILPKNKDEGEDLLMLVMPIMLNNYVQSINN